MPPELDVAGRRIASDAPCYVIAEVGHNHGGSLETALAMVDAAALAGADAVKFQKRENRTLYTRAMFDRPYQHEFSHGATYGLHREALELGEADYRILMARAAAKGIACFATAFDEASADLLARVDVPAYKIASADLLNFPLLRHVARLRKPLIVSTGGAGLADVQRMVDLVQPLTPYPLCLLHCTAAYPVEDYATLNLVAIQTLHTTFPDCVIGYSGHDPGIAMPLVAYVLGARVIEKHFTLNRAWRGTDQGWSLEPAGLRRLVRDLDRTRQAMGDGVKRVYPSEEPALAKMAKSLVTTRALPAGHVLVAADITWKSPGGGLPPSCVGEVTGLAVGRDVPEEHAISVQLEDV